jgi:hypothetical protein
MEIVIVSDSISLAELNRLAEESYGDMVKAVADIEKNVLAIGGEYHADAEQVLLQSGSVQNDLWGFNIYPDQPKESWLEYYSLINVRPRLDNRSQIIQDETIKKRIYDLVERMIAR